MDFKWLVSSCEAEPQFWGVEFCIPQTTDGSWPFSETLIRQSISSLLKSKENMRKCGLLKATAPVKQSVQIGELKVKVKLNTGYDL